MAVTINSVTDLGGGRWLLAFSSSAPPATFYLYADGVLLSTQTAGEYVLTVLDGVVPTIEILDDAATDPQPAFPSYLTLGWITDADAARYRIEEYTGGQWVEVATVAHNGQAWQSYATQALADETTHQWRVVPIDAAGNDGTAVAFVVLLVRYPDVPSVSYSYSAVTGTVTVAAV